MFLVRKGLLLPAKGGFETKLSPNKVTKYKFLFLKPSSREKSSIKGK